MTTIEKGKRLRKNGSLRSVKWLLASLSVVSTLGLWNLFASQDAASQAEADGIQPDFAGDDWTSTTSGLPPLPTLVPRPGLAGAPSGQAPGGANSAETGLPGTIIIQGARPPQPVAVSRSSK